ncbi:MAG: hypothetical protein LUE88_01905 [Clostridiales bacterium]|nr:hypothetical protein [Clostridiales bacterium]
MRKIKLLAILTVMITMLISVNAYAAVYEGEPDIIEITGGIDMDRTYESTFDSTRTITGRAECGTIITIDVCTEDEDDELVVMRSYEIEVGISGYFSKNVRLYEGENIIVISDGDGQAAVTACIRRKSEKIKNKLERGIYMPGNGSGTYFSFSMD